MANRTNTTRPHSSPGLYFSEGVETYSAKSLGITTLGVAGETLRGPAFQSIPVSNWREFQTYFGGTSTEKFKGSQYPKYELPYIAKTYLEQSNQLEVVRVLGLSGVNAGPAWVITATKHKVYTGYDYVIMNHDPYNGDETQWGADQTYTNTAVMPKAPNITEEYPQYIRVGSHSEWHTTCNDCEGQTIEAGCEFDVTDPNNQVPDPSDPSVTCDVIKVIQSYYYNAVDETEIGNPQDYTTVVNLPEPSKATYDTQDPETGEYKYRKVRILVMPVPEGQATDTDYEYYNLEFTAYCYERKVVYNYYEKVWKSGIQLAEEDYCEGNRNNMVIAVLRSRGEHKKAEFVRTPTEEEMAQGICDDFYSYDEIEYYAKDIKLEPSKTLTLGTSCNPGFSATTGDFTVDNYNYGTFTIAVATVRGETKRYSVSLNPGEKNYIYNVIGGNPEDGDAEIYVEELYDVALRQLVDEGVFNAINSEVVKYPAVKIIPKYSDVNDIATEQILGRQHKNKRYLYSTELSAGIPVKYSEDGGVTWIDGEGLNGVIYTVMNRTNPTTGKKEYFYGSYVDAVNFEYSELDSEPEGVVWIECNQTVTNEIRNSYVGFPSFFAAPTSTDPLYVRVYEAEGAEPKYYKRVVTDLVASTRKGKATERLSIYDYATDVVDGRFTNCVRVMSDDMYYVNVNAGAVTDVYPVTLDFNNYREQYRYASTPWVVSELKGSAENVELAKLFRFHTISDGNSSSSEIKVSIENIDPSTGRFDVVVRNFTDTDNSVSAVERYKGCTLVPGDPDYISMRIGSFDEKYNAVSKYITVEVIESDVTKNSVPAGFLGYPMRDYSGFAIKGKVYKYVTTTTEPTEYTEMDEVPFYAYENDPDYIKVNGFYLQKEEILTTNPTQPDFRFNTLVDEDIKPKKQYFGVSDLTGIDIDALSYKGVEAYNGIPSGLTPCFHLDSRILNGTPDENGYIEDGDLRQKVSVDGVSGYRWVTVNKNNTTSEGIEPRIGSEELMLGTIYEDKNFRKFTVAFYGGWDGWDYYRTSRSTGDEFTYRQYKGNINPVSGYGDMFDVIKNPESLDLDNFTKSITSDYYAYLAGARKFANPNSIEINVLATPGIDYVNNGQLVNDVVDMVENERADCVYVVTTPDKPFGASDSMDDMYSADEAVANLEDSDIDSNHTTSYYPWVKYFDQSNSEYIYLPVTRDVVASIARTDNQAWPWFSNAGWNRGLISGVSPKRKLKLGEQDALYDGRLNFVASFAQEGQRIWGDKTLQIADNQLNRISARRLCLRIKSLLKMACIGLIFDPNDKNCTKAVRSAVSTVLDHVKQNRGISDYRIEIDDSPSITDQMGRAVTYWIKRNPMLEWLSFVGVLTAQGVEWQ